MAAQGIINDQFLQNLQTVAQNFQQEIAQRILPYDAWLALVERETFPAGAGNNMSYIITEATFAADETTWVPLLQTSDTAPNQTVLAGDIVPTAQTVRNAPLEQKALNSNDIQLLKEAMAFQFKQQLANTLKNFERAVGRVWNLYVQSRYQIACDNKLLATNGLPSIASTGSDFPTIYEPSSQLTQGMLDVVYQQLQYKNAALDGAYAELDGAPVYLLLTDMETSGQLIRNNPDIRQDIRFAEPSQLLQPLNASRVYKGYCHKMLVNQPRFNFVAGALVPVPQYTTVATTSGNKQILNPNYINASVGISYVFHKDVMHLMVPDWPSNLGSNVNYKPQNYLGEVMFQLYGISPQNPDGDIGFFRSRMLAASKPVFPEFGYAILHLLCPNDQINLQGCIYTS